jgi:hypothetical protein
VLKDEQDSAGQIDNDEHKRKEQDCEQNVGRAAVRKGHPFTEEARSDSVRHFARHRASLS